MARFEVTISEMQSAAGRISAAAQDFLASANQAMEAATALGDTWEGDSQVAFMQEQQQANAWYRQMVELVNTYVESLNNAARAYAEADEAARSNIASR